MADRGSLENCCTCKRTVGSNPTPSAGSFTRGPDRTQCHKPSAGTAVRRKLAWPGVNVGWALIPLLKREAWHLG